MAEIDVDVIVVGAGLAGLMAAHVLHRSGENVLVLERDDHVGGRAATIEIGGGVADTGAQFFTARIPEFINWVHQWELEKIVYMWSHGFAHGSTESATNDGHPRYAVAGGMSALARHIAADIDQVRTGHTVMTATPTQDGWLVQDDLGDLFMAKALILTPPVPLALNLLRAGATHLSADDMAILGKISYHPCLCGVFQIEGPLHLPEPGAIHRPQAPISWIADNKHKGISRTARVLTVHASAQYSHQLWGVSDNGILRALRESIKPYMESSTKIIEAQLVRWSYSLPEKCHPERYLLAEGVPSLIFAGDAFGDPRIEGAVLSGLAAARVLRGSERPQ